MDSNFPSWLLKMNEKEGKLNCITYLIQEYSIRNLTFFTHRAIAIAGLGKRLANAMCTESRFGTFERHLYHLLLWYPLPETGIRMAFGSTLLFLRGHGWLHLEASSFWLPYAKVVWH